MQKQMQNRSNMLSKIKETEEGIGRELERQREKQCKTAVD